MIAQADPARSLTASRSAAESKAANTNGRPTWHDRFLRLLPDILRHAGVRLRGLAPAAREEALAEVTAHALVAYARLVELGKEDVAYATPLATYAAALYRRGCRVGVRMNVRDVLAPACRRRNGFTVERLDRASGRWEEALVEDRRFTPADAAATRLDFRAWLATLPKRNRQLAERLAVGESTSGAARRFGVSRGRVSQLRNGSKITW